MERRDFLRTLMGATGLAVAGPIINSCASIQKEARFEKAAERYDTITHDFLDIEAGLGVIDSDYQTLDGIIYKAQKRINEIKLDKPFTEYTRDEAISVLETIDGVLEDMGFENQGIDLLNEGLKNKTLDCAGYSAIYLGIADWLDLPLKAARVPGHVFVRWYFDDNTHVNWETLHDKEYSDNFYRSRFKIVDKSIEKGVFLKDLSRKEFHAIAYNHKGLVLRKRGRYEEAIKSFDRAQELYPNYPLPYYNKGVALSHLRRYKEAIENYDKVLELNPNYSYAIEAKERCEAEVTFGEPLK